MSTMLKILIAGLLLLLILIYIQEVREDKALEEFYATEAGQELIELQDRIDEGIKQTEDLKERVDALDD